MSYRRHAEVKTSEIEWVDQIPVEWEEKRLRFMADISNSNVDKKAYDDQVSVRLCNYTDVYYNEVITPELDFMEATASQAEIKKFGLRAGDVIITKDSEDPRDIGVPAFVQADMPGVVCGYHLSIIRTSDPITAEYVQFSIMSHLNKARLYVDTPGVTRFGLDQDTIKNILVLLPPLAERQEIVRRLRSKTGLIDGLIEKKTQFIGLLKEKRAAVITHAVTKGIPHIKGKEALSKAGHLEDARLDQIFSEVTNLVPLDGIDLLTPSVVHGVVPQASLGIRPQQALRENYRVSLAQPDDFVISLSSHAHGIEHCGLHGGVSPDYTLLRPKCDPRLIPFLKYALKSRWIVFQLGTFKTGVRMGLRLTWNKVRYCKIGLPSPEVAERIADYLDNETTRIDGLITLTERSIDLLREKRAALITAAVTGKIDVRATA